jgi:antitoxin HigA-1
MYKSLPLPHPGDTLCKDVLPALGLTVTDAAEQLGVTRPALSRVLNAKAATTPKMALRPEGWLGVERVGDAPLWLEQRGAYDLWRVRRAGMPKVKKVKQVPQMA